MTLQMKLPTAFTDPDLPRFSIDPILPTQGALWLFDMNHPADTVRREAAPTNNERQTNLAASQAKALIGSGSLADYDGGWEISPNVNIATQSKFERTSKGGIHMITSQTKNPDAGAALNVIGTPIATRLGTDNGRSYYFSAWTRTTRAPVSAGSGFAPSMIEVWGPQGPPTGNYRAFMFYGRNQPDGGSVLGMTTGPQFGSVRGDDYYGTQSNAAGTIVRAAVLGLFGVYNFDAGFNLKDPSRIVYRSYCEDLTASGRSYADVDALDRAMFVKDVVSPGGRYYGDTFTDPATIP